MKTSGRDGTGVHVDDDRDDDSADEDLLDMIGSNDWSKLQQYESTQRRKQQVKGDVKSTAKGSVKVETPVGKTTEEKKRTESSMEEQEVSFTGKRNKNRVKTTTTTTTSAAGTKNKTALERHKADNERRLESLKVKQQQSKQQSSLIKTALAAVVSDVRASSRARSSRRRWRQW